jgi:redox-sensitive bicupin YhaK (pirin superfamily)
VIALRRAADRHHDQGRKLETWLTFDQQDRAALLVKGLANIEILKESRLAPGAGVPRTSGQDAEILTFVREGALAYENSLGGSGIIQAGEFQRVTAGQRLRHGLLNASRSDWVHFFQIWLRPAEVDLEPGCEQKRFTAAQRRGGLCAIASPDARRGSLRIHQDALVYSALLDPGQHVVRELSQGRSAWIHVVQGEIIFGDSVLCTGDGAGVTIERAVSLTAREESEILLVDLGETLQKPLVDSGSSPRQHGLEPTPPPVILTETAPCILAGTAPLS